MIKFMATLLIFVTLPCYGAYTPELFKDELVESTLQNTSSKYPEANLDYDYNDINYLPVRIRFKEKISSKKSREGDIIKFEVVEDVQDESGKRIIDAGTIGIARIETIAAREGYGVPADILISRFDIDGLNKKHFDGDISKHGKNLTILALGLKYSVCAIFPGSHFLLLLMKGGNATIKPKDIFIIKYLP